MERYIAIDNVCAWPNLTWLPDGTIITTIFNQPCHGLCEGDVECWASEDGGRVWRLRGTPAVHEPGTNRMNVAAGLAANGDMIVLASGWSHRPPVGQSAGHGAPAHPLLPWVCRSTDGGRSWQHAGTLSAPAGQEHAIPFGDIIQLADGCLGVSLYAGGGAFFYASADDGNSWQHRSTIRGDGLTETTLLTLPDGHVLACARTEGDQHLELFRSTDHGASWQQEQVLSQGSQHPAGLLNLPDGRVLLTYGDRRQDHWGIEVRVSNDAGHSWNPPLRVVELEGGDLGYPATVPGHDETLVTAWYCHGVAAHQRYHMGVAIWRVGEIE